MQLSEKTKSTLRTLLPLLFGIGVFTLIYRGMDWGELSKALHSEVHYPVLIFSLLFGLVANILRGLRWELLIAPLVPDSPPRKINAILTVLGSYTVNMGIPRAGELWRCAEMKRYEQLSFTSLLGTLITDRLTDVLSLLSLLVVALVWEWDFFSLFLDRYPTLKAFPVSLVSSPWFYATLIVGACLFFWGVRWLRQGVGGRIHTALMSILSGIASVRSMPHRALFLLYTLLIWGCYFAFFYTTFFAFDATKSLGIGVGLIAFVMSSASMVAPVQGGLGPWHFMVITTLTLYGVSERDAGVFALVVHTTQTLWITLVGLISIFLLPMINKHYRRITSIS